MANDFKVYFLGLVCHIGEGPKTHAALVVDDEHLTVVATEKECLVLQPGDVIAFADEQGADASGPSDVSDQHFRDAVIHLQTFVGDALEPSVAKHEGTLASYALYPRNSKLSVAWFFTQLALHRNATRDKQRTGCVARLTVATTPEALIAVVVNGKTYLTAGAPEILIANVAHGTPEYEDLSARCEPRILLDHKPTHTATDHFNRFGKIVLGDTTCTVAQQTGTCNAKQQQNVPQWILDLFNRAGSNVGCGNTNWP